MVELHKLLKSINVLESWNDENINITGIAYNSNKIEKGNIFVCIKGYKTDGHKYIKEAIFKGAVAIVVEEYQDGYEIPQYRVEDCRSALAALGASFYGFPSKSFKTIGITGTNGKTSTAFMANAILEDNGYKTGLIGTVLVKTGNEIEASSLTTPESLDLQHYFYNMKAKHISHVCMEVSSSALELKRVSNVDFDIVTFNNISREHIDLHGTFDKYFNSKASLIRNAGSNQFAILNLDDKYSKSLINETKAKTITFGVNDNSGDFWCKNIDVSTGRPKFVVEIRNDIKIRDVNINKGEFTVELGTSGYHSVYNSIVAIIIGLLCNVPVPKIQESLKNFKGVERRFEMIYEDDFKVIDDHFANSGNIKVTFDTLKLMDYKNVKIVYAIRGSRGVTVNRENAEVIAKLAPSIGLKEITATLSKSHVIDKDIVQKEESDVFLEYMKKSGIKVKLFDELQDSIKSIISEVKTGDVILLAGCQGMDYGAKIALEEIAKKRGFIDKNLLFKPLEKRVAGIKDIEI